MKCKWLSHLTHKILSCLSLLTVLWSEKEFHDAAKRNDTEKMQELMKKGVDVKAKNKVSLLLDKHQTRQSKTNYINQGPFHSTCTKRLFC